MSTSVKQYKKDELLERVKSLNSFTHIPSGYWIIGVRSNEDVYNVYDDKFYLFLGTSFIMVFSGTTNPGSYGLKKYFKWNKYGAAVIKSDEIYYGVYQKSDNKKIRHHNSKMQCLRQIKPFKYYRDGNQDNKSDENSDLRFGIISANFHCNSYVTKKGIVSWLINGWSTACQVSNDLDKYWQMIHRIPYDNKITYCLLKEF